MLSPDRFFEAEPKQKAIALDLYTAIQDLPIIAPHGHVDPALFASPDQRFGSPVQLLIQPDHYVLRMLISQGISYAQLLDNSQPRQVWRLFAQNYRLFRGTPSGIWLAHELETVFGVAEKLGPENADRIYDQIEDALASPACSPRALFERFNIAILATTDAATDTLEYHQAIQASGWSGKIIPTFRPDHLAQVSRPEWKQAIQKLSQVSGVEVVNYPSFIQALEQRRAYFKSMGATATDSGVFQTDAAPLSPSAANTIFYRALQGTATEAEEKCFTANLLYEMARMSAEDGLVMQIHPGVFRNHSSKVTAEYGADRGFDIPVSVEFTRGLRPVLEAFGHHPNFNLILFTLDETTYARELAPIAGAYPAVKLGPPWWFNDSVNGMRRYFDQVMETAGLYNTAGFNDDTRAFPSIPARHDVWRRMSANWLAGLVVRGMIDCQEAGEMARDLAGGLAKRAYRLEGDY